MWLQLVCLCWLLSAALKWGMCRRGCEGGYFCASVRLYWIGWTESKRGAIVKRRYGVVRRNFADVGSSFSRWCPNQKLLKLADCKCSQEIRIWPFDIIKFTFSNSMQSHWLWIACMHWRCVVCQMHTLCNCCLVFISAETFFFFVFHSFFSFIHFFFLTMIMSWMSRFEVIWEEKFATV